MSGLFTRMRDFGGRVVGKTDPFQQEALAEAEADLPAGAVHVDAMVAECGRRTPLERYWRDLRTAGTHICNVSDTAYTSWANHELQTGIRPNTH